MPLRLLERVVYGPVKSRRLGRSLGVNVLPAGMKICNMDCAYCQYGATGRRELGRNEKSRWPQPARVEASVAARIRRAAAEGELLDRITVAGHGEPTLHPDFEEISERLARVRDRLAPGLRLAILSNSTTAAWPDVRRALALFDERHMKLDAGDAMTYALVNGTCIGSSHQSIGAIVEALSSLPRVIVQAMFVRDAGGEIDNTTEGAVREWLSALERIQPERVEIYTLDRPAALSRLRPAPFRRLREIAGQVHAAGIPADVFR